MADQPPSSDPVAENYQKNYQAVELQSLIDREAKRVAYAESDKYLVDTLFSLLTMPIGALVRRVGKESNLGCMDTLYGAVERMDSKFFQSAAAKKMLLHPNSAADQYLIRDLTLPVATDADDDLHMYVCQSWECATVTRRLYTTTPCTSCPCGSPMTALGRFPKHPPPADGEDGVFVKGGMRFVISDDLEVTPFSTTAFRMQLNKINELRNRNGSVFEKKTLMVGPAEVTIQNVDFGA
ncbi:hypothetical protein ACLOJK_011157 [Asimina triloba]